MSFFFGRWCQETPGCGLSFFAKVAHAVSTDFHRHGAASATRIQAHSTPNVPMEIFLTCQSVKHDIIIMLSSIKVPMGKKG